MKAIKALKIMESQEEVHKIVTLQPNLGQILNKKEPP
jgi:hypothetical protein